MRRLIGALAVFLVVPAAYGQLVADPDFDISVADPAFAAGQGPLVLIDEGHNNYHTGTGRYQPFADILRNDGYRVSAHHGAFTSESLDEVGIVVIASAIADGITSDPDTWLPVESAFSRDEITVLVDWVRGGGGLFLAFGMVCALLETQKSDKGQVVDASMLDGANALMALFHGFRAMGLFDGEPGTHFFGGAAHYYDTYETRDNKFISIGSIEPEFYQQLIELLELDAERFSPWAFNLRIDETTQAAWRELKAEMADVFRSKTRDEWCVLLEGTDVCFAPVLSVAEATEHPHNQARRIFVEVDGVVQNAPAPRFSRTPTSQPSAPRIPGADTVEILEASNFSADEIRKLQAAGAVVQAS